MDSHTKASPLRFTRDVTAGIVVFLVALPLCLGVALASDAPLLAGVLAGIIGGIVVGILSGSQTSVSGPAAGLTAIVAAQIASLGSYQAFLLAVVLAGILQIVLGCLRAGHIKAFFPSAVIKGLLAAIGVILILKQLPHLLGHDLDPEGDMAFQQPDHENTFTEIFLLFGDVHAGAAVIGVFSLVLLMFWDRVKALKQSLVPAPLVVVLMGVAISEVLKSLSPALTIGASHLVQVPVGTSLTAFFEFLQLPDFGQFWNPAIYKAALTLAVVASLETLLNLEGVDKIDPQKRVTPPNRELLAQGTGNIISGLVGGLPLTSVIVRSSVNINAGSRSKLSAILHGVLLLVSVIFLPDWLNRIPLASLAAILLYTGVKLASPALVKQMWDGGRYQFIPFIVTLVAIVLTDLLIGILIGMAVSIGFILNSNMRHPLRCFVEKQLGGDVLHVELANQVSFLNRAALTKIFDSVARGWHVLLDAQHTNYINPDILDLIRDFTEHTGPARGVKVSLLGFRNKYHLKDQINYVDYSTRDMQRSLTPPQVLQILKDGNQRFLTGHRLTRDFRHLVNATAEGQHPLAVVLSCIDSRTPAELIFDLGVGDVFVVRIAGNVTSRKVLGSVEYACAVAGAKLIVVMGHTRCGAVTAAVDLVCSARSAVQATGCQHLDHIVHEIQKSINPLAIQGAADLPPNEKDSFVNLVARRNILRSVESMYEQSQTLARLTEEGKLAIVGAMYDVVTGEIEFVEGGLDTELEERMETAASQEF